MSTLKPKSLMDEDEMREAKVPTPKTIEELIEYISSLVDRPHDYGTSVYAMSQSAVAAFNFVANKLSVSGFQASCADLDILRHTRGLEVGRVLDFSKLLYPQYKHDFESLNWDALINDNKAWLKERATKLLKDSTSAAPDVIAHWEKLAR
jgi:hypothetical protein